MVTYLKVGIWPESDLTEDITVLHNDRLLNGPKGPVPLFEVKSVNIYIVKRPPNKNNEKQNDRKDVKNDHKNIQNN